MKRAIVLFLFVISILIFLTGCFYNKIDRDIKHYLKSGDYIDEYAIKVMPTLDSLPKYNNISYQYYYENRYFTRTMLLVVDYDKDTYEAEKRNLDSIYTFLDHIVKGEFYEDDFLIPEYEFSVGNYSFRVIDRKGDVYAYYPHYFGMIAMSDVNNSIAYISFYNQSLDFISSTEYPQSMAEFVEENFPYEW